MAVIARGTRAASVEDILAAAGVSRRTFYRLYDGKEDVLLAIYRTGTDRLVAEIERAVARDEPALVRLERSVDAHLDSARYLGRLVYLLGGEASHQDSVLYRHRMAVHATIVGLLARSFPQADPLVLRGLLLALEAVTRVMLDECDEGRAVTPEALARARGAMLRIAAATLAGSGPGVPPLPAPPT